MHVRFNEEIVNVQTTDEIMNMVILFPNSGYNYSRNILLCRYNFFQVPSGEVLSRPLQAGLTLEQAGILENMNLTTQPGLLGGKVHGSLARAGKVKGQTPKVDAEEKKKAKTGRAKRRMQVRWLLPIYFYILFKYNRRFVNVVPSFGKKKGPNSNS